MTTILQSISLTFKHPIVHGLLTIGFGAMIARTNIILSTGNTQICGALIVGCGCGILIEYWRNINEKINK